MRRRSDARGDYGLEAMRVRDEEARLPYFFGYRLRPPASPSLWNVRRFRVGPPLPRIP